jgi:adenosylhomocysteine nucleosidase
VSVVAVAGLAFEARIAARAGIRVVCSGDGQTLAAALDRAIGEDCGGLISFGVAGGLSPELECGTCVVGSAILSDAARYATDERWSRNLLGAIPDGVYGAILGVPAPVIGPDDKYALFRSTGAVAVDTESHIVASVACALGLPMVAVRVIVDPAAHTLPKSTLAAVRPNGSVSIAAVIAAAIKNPAELVALPRIALAAHAARATLARTCRLLGPGFGLPDSESESSRFSGNARTRWSRGAYGVPHRRRGGDGSPASIRATPAA